MGNSQSKKDIPVKMEREVPATIPVTKAKREQLIREAIDARENSYSPYSGYAVGAALLAKNGRIYRGCNVENASYGATCCAERNAVFKAVGEGLGKGDFIAIAVAGGPRNGDLVPSPPCGICRQVLAEFANPADFAVLWVTEVTDGKPAYELHTLEELLPGAFAL